MQPRIMHLCLKCHDSLTYAGYSVDSTCGMCSTGNCDGCQKRAIIFPYLVSKEANRNGATVVFR